MGPSRCFQTGKKNLHKFVNTCQIIQLISAIYLYKNKACWISCTNVKLPSNYYELILLIFPTHTLPERGKELNSDV